MIWALIGFLVVVERCRVTRAVVDVLVCARRIVGTRSRAVVDCCKLVERTGNVVVRIHGDGIVDCVCEYVAVDCHRDVDTNVGEVVVSCCVFVGRCHSIVDSSCSVVVGRCIDAIVCNVAVRRSIVGRRNVVGCSNVVGSSRRRRRLEDEVPTDLMLPFTLILTTKWFSTSTLILVTN